MAELPIHPYPGRLSLDAPSQEISVALDNVDNDIKAHAYRASLGYYKSNLKLIRKTREELVVIINRYAKEALRYPGDAPPPIEARTVGKMDMKGVPGLNIQRTAGANRGASSVKHRSMDH
jgi:ATP-dependent RNA helicase MSS116